MATLATRVTGEGSMSTFEQQIVLAHFIVTDDLERSRRFYTEVLGGEMVIGGEGNDAVTYVALANSWVIINVGGGPTDDKPTVILETPGDPDRVSSFLNIRVADIEAVYEEWSAKGAEFLTPRSRRNRNPLLHPRSRRLPDRGGPNHGHTAYAMTWTCPVDTSTTPRAHTSTGFTHETSGWLLIR